MAANSFLLKGWAVTVIGVLIGLTANTDHWEFGSIIAILVCIGFWYLDAEYLKLERLYKRKYNWVIKHRLNKTDYAFNLDPFEKNMWLTTESKNLNTLCVMFSKTLFLLYLVMLIASSSKFWLPCILTK